jgi:hypothetical protein
MRRLRSWTRPRQERELPACCNLQPAPHSRRALLRCLRSVQTQRLLTPREHPHVPCRTRSSPLRQNIRCIYGLSCSARL